MWLMKTGYQITCILRLYDRYGTLREASTMVQHQSGYDPQLCRIRILDRPNRDQLYERQILLWSWLHPQWIDHRPWIPACVSFPYNLPAFP